VAGAEAYLHAKFDLDPSNRLATVHQRHRQERQDRQRSDSIGRTVLQTVAQKLKAVFSGMNCIIETKWYINITTNVQQQQMGDSARAKWVEKWNGCCATFRGGGV